MNNVMKIGGYQAVIAFDPEISMFRGEFPGLNGGADFYAADVDGLHREGEISLRVFLEACRQRGIDPRKHYSGKFVLRLDPVSYTHLDVYKRQIRGRHPFRCEFA